jgi:maleylacetate reductase
MIAVPSTLSGGEYNAGCLVTDTHRKLADLLPSTDDAAGDRWIRSSRCMRPDMWIGSGARAMDPPWRFARRRQTIGGCGRPGIR